MILFPFIYTFNSVSFGLYIKIRTSATGSLFIAGVWTPNLDFVGRFPKSSKFHLDIILIICILVFLPALIRFF